ncbi:MAG: pitrilysin family protein [Candidatus Pacebacteria bacterium]|nr:pitrilysin family protein [Candidatus Paceibacterota bacterium]
MHQFKKHILKNGLRVILAPNPQSLATTALVLVEAGSEYETKKINGVSHFLEHLCFKGTKKRPSPMIIASEMESLGAVYNAFTSNELTGYFTKVSPEKIDAGLDIIADMYLNPIFDEKEIEKEKGVIIEEINMYEDMPMRRVQEYFSELLYGNQPAGWLVTGEKQNIKDMTKADIVNYRKAHYSGKATVVVVAGSFDEKKMLEKIEKLFADTPISKKTAKIKVKESQKSPQLVFKHKDSDQTHLILGVRAFDMYDKRKYIIEILSQILGGGMSSRLFQKIRGEMGAAYYVRCGADLFTDHGYLAVSAGVDHTKADAVVEAILEEFNKIKNESVGAKELERAKNHLIGNFLIGLETSDAQAIFYGQQELFKEKIKVPEQTAKEIRKVTAADVMKVAKDVIRNGGLNLAVIGPFENAQKFDKILKL